MYLDHVCPSNPPPFPWVTPNTSPFPPHVFSFVLLHWNTAHCWLDYVQETSAAEFMSVLAMPFPEESISQHPAPLSSSGILLWPLFHGISWDLLGRVWFYVLLRTEHSVDTYSLYFDQFWVSTLTASYCREKLLAIVEGSTKLSI